VRAVIQRVSSASVRVGDEVTGAIETGLLVLLGAEEGDEEKDLAYLLDKVVNLRVFEDDEGRMNRSLEDVGGAMLVVSQFTLLGDCRKGRRPSFVKAMAPEPAEAMIDELVRRARERGVRVETGRFRADMKVSLVNDGPVTVLVDSRKLF
jgi:D-tyrosyl-tRNA(Tyr) deacylase